MPVYEYECAGAVTHKFSELVGGQWPEPTVCRHCDATVRKVVSRAKHRWMKGQEPLTDPARVEARQRYDAWFETEGKAKLAAGTHEIDLSDPMCDNGNGEQASSSVTSLLESGYLRSLATREERENVDTRTLLTEAEKRALAEAEGEAARMAAMPAQPLSEDVQADLYASAEAAGLSVIEADGEQ